MTAEIGDGLRYVWDTKVVRVLVAMVAVMSIFGFSYSVLMPAYAAEVLGVGEGLGAHRGGRRRRADRLADGASLTRSRQRGQLTFGSLLFPIALIASPFSLLTPSLAHLVVVGFGFIIQNTTSNTLVQMSCPISCAAG